MKTRIYGIRLSSSDHDRRCSDWYVQHIVADVGEGGLVQVAVNLIGMDGEMPNSSLIERSSMISRTFNLVIGRGPFRSYDSLDQVRISSIWSSSNRTLLDRSWSKSRWWGWSEEGMKSRSAWVESLGIGSMDWREEIEERLDDEREVERALRQGLRGEDWIEDEVWWTGWNRVSRLDNSQHSSFWWWAAGLELGEGWWCWFGFLTIEEGDEVGLSGSISARSRSSRSSVDDSLES